jgi:hypothetical protein
MRGRYWSNTGWALGGFVCGAVFWHAVGFWSFMSDIISSTQQSRMAASAQDAAGWQTDVRTPQAAPSPIRQTVAGRRPALVHLPDCSVVLRDRRTGETSLQPCPGHLPPVVVAATRGPKADLGVHVGLLAPAEGETDLAARIEASTPRHTPLGGLMARGSQP